MIPQTTYDSTKLPMLTGNQPGIGGEIKRHNEDFRVEELPRYLPSGEGTHTYFLLEKSGLTTLAAIRILGRALGRPAREFGYAGMKDAHGITRQVMSIEHMPPERVERLELANMRIIWTNRHTNKIKLGHLAGNRFVILVRDAAGSAESRKAAAEAVMATLVRRGVPNYFGPQRFGARGDTGRIGTAVVHGDYEEALAILLGRPVAGERRDFARARQLYDSGDFAAAADAWPGSMRDQIRLCRLMAKSPDARQAWRAVSLDLRRLFLNAFQSELFNRVLADRLARIDQLEDGDIAYKHANGACFHVEDAAVEQPRCTAFEISPTGPLFGSRMTAAAGAPGEREAAVLAESGLTPDRLARVDGAKMDGARRPLRVPIDAPAVGVGSDERGPFLSLAFSLPPGAYATCVTREVCKTETALHEDAAEA